MRLSLLSILAMLLLSGAAPAQPVVNTLTPSAPTRTRPPSTTPPQGAFAPATPPAASAAPQLAPQYAKTIREIEFLPNETTGEYIARMKKRREAAEAKLAAARTRHSDAMQAIRERASSPGQ